ncbi:hypothetical protein RB195_018747 [Necator americanus]|uniref:C2H2-type domain-containing protein n=1 Tax=Necator americanus TaxID=51031 RepID=A0ABR1CC65_NECAM
MHTSAPCNICGKGPLLLRNLYRHMRDVHMCSDEEVNNVKNAVKRAIHAEEFNCEDCGRTFFKYSAFRKHRKNVHRRCCHNITSKRSRLLHKLFRPMSRLRPNILQQLGLGEAL